MWQGGVRGYLHAVITNSPPCKLENISYLLERENKGMTGVGSQQQDCEGTYETHYTLLNIFQGSSMILFSHNLLGQ